MSRTLLICGLWLIFPALLDSAAAQHSAAREELRQAREAAARGDTLAALAALDRAVALEQQLAEAHYFRGQIYATRASARATDFEDRLRAQAAFEQALHYDPHNALYLLELGKLMLKQQIRLDAQRVLKRSLDAADKADPAVRAEVNYQLGLLYETQWQRFRYRHNLPNQIAQLDADRAFDDARYVWRLLDASMFPGADQGVLEREQMLQHFRAALAADPMHVGAGSHLLAYYYDEGQLEELMALARKLVRAAPDAPLSHLGLALGLHRQAKEDEAFASFQRALSLMPAAERREFEELTRILTKDAEKEYKALTEEQQAEYRRRFWAHSDPLFLTRANEFWLEYMARMAYADIRFAVQEYGLRGWETDRGVIYIRYGEPARKATFGVSAFGGSDFEAWGRVTTVWSYGYQGPVFVFRQNPGYRRATFANDFRFFAEDYRSLRPVELTTPAIPERMPLAVQAARFRSADGQMDLEVHALLPLDRLGKKAPVVNGEIETGLFLQDEQANEVQRLTRREVMDFRAATPGRRESWVLTVPAGRQYLLGIEAREPLTWHAAVGRAIIEKKEFPPGTISVSDLLLADELEPRTSEPYARHDYRIVANPALSYEPDRPIGVYFEIYNLLPDSAHFASYELELVVTVKEIERAGPALEKILGELADKWGFTREGDRAVQLRFNKDARVLARDLITEHFEVRLPESPPGRYGLKLIVRDRNSGREAAAEREFRIRRVGEDGN